MTIAEAAFVFKAWLFDWNNMWKAILLHVYQYETRSYIDMQMNLRCSAQIDGWSEVDFPSSPPLHCSPPRHPSIFCFIVKKGSYTFPT